MKKESSSIKKVIITSVLICTLVLVGILGSYAFFISSGTNNPENVSTNTGTLSLTFADGNAGITESLEFGSSIEKTFTIENTGTLEAVAKINFEDLVNTYLESSLTYTLSYSETEDGTYSEVVSNENVPVSESSSTQVLADSLIIPTEAKYFYKLTIILNYLEDIDQTADLNAIFSTHFKLEESKKLTSKDTLAKLNLTVKEGQPNFAEPATTNETANGLFSLEDDYGTSYYYRGKVENNYVKFGDYFWRIIRINGDGSLRMIYDGEQAYANGTRDTGRLAWQNQTFNTNYNDAKYVGYMYGPAGTGPSTSKEEAQSNTESSTIKTKLEEWYVTNIKDKGLDQYVADSIFCNDRSTPGQKLTQLKGDTSLGFGTNPTGFGATSRIGSHWNNTKPDLYPSFICPQKNDAFTVSDTAKGNGALNEKIGLITADEIVAGGSGKWNTKNAKYYLYKGHMYWTLSPYYFNSTAVEIDVYTDGNTDFFRVDTLGGIAPVISLTPEYVKTLVGDGTMDNPYQIKN